MLRLHPGDDAISIPKDNLTKIEKSHFKFTAKSDHVQLKWPRNVYSVVDGSDFTKHKSKRYNIIERVKNENSVNCVIALYGIFYIVGIIDCQSF